MPPLKLLYLHGLGAVGGGFKARWLADEGYDVDNPHLPDDDFASALAIAQGAFERRRPDCVVGSSRGGAVAMNLDRDGCPLVLLAPAWMRWGTARTVKPPAVVLHSPQDELIPVDFSRELVAASGLGPQALVLVGTAHGMTDPPALQALVAAIEQVTGARPSAS